MIAREAWRAQHGRGNTRVTRQAVGVVIHHAFAPDIPAGLSEAEVAPRIRSIEDHHARTLTPTNKRIGYNWLVDQDGRIFEGVGWGRVGAHAPGANSTHEGICFLIDGDRRAPTTVAINAVRALIRAGVMLDWIRRDYRVRMHSEFSATRCPGDKVRAILTQFAPGSVMSEAADEVPALPPPSPEVLDYLARFVAHHRR